MVLRIMRTGDVNLDVTSSTVIFSTGPRTEEKRGSAALV
jgi:hypothetical protein